MKKLFYCAAFVAAMGLFTTANAQDTAQKKEVKKEQCDKKCDKQTNPNKAEVAFCGTGSLAVLVQNSS